MVEVFFKRVSAKRQKPQKQQAKELNKVCKNCNQLALLQRVFLKTFPEVNVIKLFSGGKVEAKIR